MELINNIKNYLTFNRVSFTPANYPKEIWREIICGAEDAMKKLPGASDGPEEANELGYGTLKHTFVDGAYVRQITMAKGSLFTSQIHKYKHPYFIMKGECTVFTEDGQVRLKAPFWDVTNPGTKRLLFMHEEVIWITVHVTDKENLKDIQKEITFETFSEMDEFHQQKMIKLLEDR